MHTNRDILKRWLHAVPTPAMALSAVLLAGPTSVAAPSSDKLEEVILVYKSHFDIGYTHLASEVIERYRTRTIEQALAVVDENKDLPADQQFVWTIPGWPMKKILEDWEGQTPERRRRVRAAFKDGRFAVHALPVTMQTEFMEPEGMVRGLGHASALAREAGRPLPTGAKMTDVPSHSRFLPTLLRHAGVHFLHLGCNPGSAPPEVPFLFWWEGPDGSRVLTMYSASYGNGLLPPGGWKHKTWIAMIMGSDNKPPPSPEKVRGHIEEIRRKLPGVRVRVGSLSDFGDRMMQEDLDDLPVITKDMPDTWNHGQMCDPEGMILNRQAVPELSVAETLHSLLAGWQAPAGDPAATLAAGYENSMLFYEHTWGGAIDWLGKYQSAENYIGRMTNWHYGDRWRAELKTDKFDRIMASWEEHTDYARNAADFSSSALDDGMQALARAVDTAGPRTVLFNPLPWKRDAVVAGSLIRDIPAGGYVTLPGPRNSPAPEAVSIKPGKTHENRHFKVVLDPATGSIRSLVDKRSGRELVDTSSEHGFGQYLHEKFSADEVAAYCKAYIRGEQTPEDLYEYGWAYAQIGKPNMPPASEVPYRALTPSKGTLTATRQGATTILEMHFPGEEDGVDYPVSTRVLLHDDAPWVDLEVTIEKPADNLPEASWICLPFKIDSPRFRVGRNGFIMDPAHDIIAGSNRYMYAVGTGTAIFDEQGRGVGVCAPDTPLLSLGEPGCWKFDRSHVPEKPAAYFNLFNNQWSTNYRLWNEGKWTYRFRIWSFDQYDPAASLVTPSLEMRHPVRTASADAPAGKLPSRQSGLHVSRPGVLVTAFGSNPDGEGTLLRLWEQAGVSGELSVRLPGGNNATTATPVNLRGEKTGEALTIHSGTLTFDLGAYSPASFLLTR